MRFTVSLCAALCLIAASAQAEMIIRTLDGQTFNVPVSAEQIRSIEFTDSNRQSLTYAGEWDTNWGRMTLHQDGTNLMGSYETDGGKLSGAIEDGKFIGIWSENASSVQCTEPRDGRRYWGKVVFTLSKDRQSMTGLWEYCFNDPNRATQSPWTAKRLAGQ